MAVDITKLTLRQKTQTSNLIQQSFAANRVYFTSHKPVADLAALAALAAPVEGETRMIESELPLIVNYTYHSTIATPTVTCDDGSAGGWVNADPASVSELWVAEFDYKAGDFFEIVSSVDAVDINGNEVLAGVPYGAYYVDSSGAAIDYTSGTTLDAAEIALMLTENTKATDQVWTQADTDAIITD